MGVQLLKDRICSSGSKFHPVRADPLENAGKKDNDRDSSPENVPIHPEISISSEKA